MSNPFDKVFLRDKKSVVFGINILNEKFKKAFLDQPKRENPVKDDVPFQQDIARVREKMALLNKQKPK